MNIQIDDEYKKLCYIQSIKPGKLNSSLTIILLIMTLITLGLPILLYWKWQRFKNFIHHIIFQQVQKDSQQVQYYLIVDSKKYQGSSRQIYYRNQIITPYLIQYEKDQRRYIHQEDNKDNNNKKNKVSTCVKYFQHRNLKYVLRDNTLESLKFKINKSFQQYFYHGLEEQEINQSLKVYGRAQSFLISFFDILKKIIYYKSFRLAIMFFAIKKLIYGIIFPQKQNQKNQFIVSMIILAQIILTWVIILIITILGSQQHNKIHDKLQNDTKYKVIRNGQQIEVKLNDLYVGDVVIPQINQIIYFKGLVAVQFDKKGYFPYVIVNQKIYNRDDKPVLKIPLQSHLTQIDQTHVINAGSQILNMNYKKQKVDKKSPQITKTQKTQKPQQKPQKQNYRSHIYRPSYESQKQQNKSQTHGNNKSEIRTSQQPKFYIIVSDNNYIQKYYKSYKQSCYYSNFESIRTSFDFQQFVFSAIFLIISLIGTLYISIKQKTHQHWISLIFSNIVLCFPFNMALFCNISQIISIIRLQKYNISVINPTIQQIGLINHLSLQLSSFQKLQYRGYIKKQRCARLADPQKFQQKNAIFDIYKKAKQESIFTLLAWAGMMNFHDFEKQPLYKQIFKGYFFGQKQRNQYDDEYEDKPRIINQHNLYIKIDWKQQRRYLLSDQFIKSVIVQNVDTDRIQNKLFIIAQGQYTSQDCLDYFDQLMDQLSIEQYKDLMRRLHSQGKKIKYIAFKRIHNNSKQFHSITKSQLMNFSRQDIQNKMLFGGFLIFDYWPSPQNIEILLQFDHAHYEVTHLGINLSIYSVRQQNGLIGYDHILRNTKIFYSMNSLERLQQIYMNKINYTGTAHIGHGIIDQPALLASDISINKLSQSHCYGDFQLNNSQSVINLLSQGAWSLYNTTLTVVCLVLFNFGKIVGQLIVFQQQTVKKVQAPPISATIDDIFLIDIGAMIVPLLLLNVYQPNQKLIKKHHKNFFRTQLMFHVFISIVGLLVLYGIQFIDHGFSTSCQVKDIITNQRNLLSIRSYEHSVFDNQTMHPCEGIINFITISFAFLVILLIDRESEQRKAKNLIIGMINKVFMLLVWIGSILYYKIPTKNAIRSIIVILALTILVYLGEFIQQKKRIKKQTEQYQQSIRQSIQSQIR